ncbi:unnamed protein product [Eruca vesicaria subsp. sativa]|uniref:F-box domain-containing protein n=1 Tax=Eruca vesicaria subsp. sativa TaxID=29727 RepID=A0ABC8IMY8_ERUVS|nr:unnamed protein product [Eruca vesicaria subsp. sativa]
MASSKRSWSLSLLPPEIIQEIFYKTPAEALVRSKPTCKKWYDLITEKRFIYQHLRRSQERFIRIFETVQTMDPNEFQPPYEIDTMVHCDGLMLCKFVDLMTLSCANLALWNPITRRIRWIKPVKIITSGDYYGIGYNSRCKKEARDDDGYKIVKFHCGGLSTSEYGPFGYSKVPQVEIYEFNTSLWRTIGGQKVDSSVKFTCKCVAVMGNMYWVALSDETPGEEFILGFDFSDETFKEICFCPPTYDDFSHLASFNGDSLSLLQQDRVSRNIEVWVSSKLGDGDVSFSKYLSLSGPDLPALQVHNDATRPVYCFVKTKSVILWCVGVEGEGDKVCCFSTLHEIDEDGVRNEKVIERGYVDDYSSSFLCGYVYVPSLVPLP